MVGGHVLRAYCDVYQIVLADKGHTNHVANGKVFIGAVIYSGAP